MSQFEPELGQALFSNSPWQHIETPYYVTQGINLLDEMTPCALPATDNYGADGNFDNGTFALRGYCWCDGDLPDHKDGCPPNFQYGDFEARWYKHSERGASCNRPMLKAEWLDVMLTCLTSLKGPS